MQRSLSSTCNTRAPVCSKYISARARNNITCSFTCGLRTVYLINLKNLICVDIVKCQVKFCILLDFLHIILFLTNLASTGGPHEISRRAACGPRVGQHWPTASNRSTDRTCRPMAELQAYGLQLVDGPNL